MKKICNGNLIVSTLHVAKRKLTLSSFWSKLFAKCFSVDSKLDKVHCRKWFYRLRPRMIRRFLCTFFASMKKARTTYLPNVESTYKSADNFFDNLANLKIQFQITVSLNLTFKFFWNPESFFRLNRQYSYIFWMWLFVLWDSLKATCSQNIRANFSKLFTQKAKRGIRFVQ